MTTTIPADLDSIFQELKKLPDYDRYPYPEVFYEHFKLKKPQPAAVAECVAYNTPPHQSLNKNGKVEIRKPAEGGVRPMPELLELPVEVTMVKDESENDMLQDSEQMTSNPPIEDSNSEILPGWDHQSLNPFYAAPDSVHDAPCHDAECSPASQQHQNELS